MGALSDHLAGGAATVCRCWVVTRKDATVLGFTDHDEDLAFDGVVFRANSGLTARALDQATGLSVDNSEVVGVLRDAGVTEADVVAGRFDSANVDVWLVNWAEPGIRELVFRGALGEIEQVGGSFRAELRSLSERLNEPQGYVFHGACSAILGDARCGVDTSLPGFRLEGPVAAVTDGRRFRISASDVFLEKWFERGRLTVLSGAAAGLVGAVKTDRLADGGRDIELWEELRAVIAAGDTVRIEAGCDKRAETCRAKFGNFLNFRGFPHVPGEDWQIAYPARRV